MNGKASNPSPLGRLRLFIVEDSLAIRDVLIKNLTNIPGVVLSGVADSESGALEFLAQHACDVMIVDIKLREGNGMSLLRALAGSPQHAESVKIIFSNNVSDFYRRVSGQFGVQFVFDKASDFLQLRALVQKLAEHPC